MCVINWDKNPAFTSYFLPSIPDTDFEADFLLFFFSHCDQSHDSQAVVVNQKSQTLQHTPALLQLLSEGKEKVFVMAEVSGV